MPMHPSGAGMLSACMGEKTSPVLSRPGWTLMERASRCRAVHLVRMQPQLVSHGVFVRLFVRPAAPVAAPLGVMVVLEHFGAFDGGVPTVGAAAPADVHANEHAHHRPEPYARAHSHTHNENDAGACGLRVDYVWM